MYLSENQALWFMILSNHQWHEDLSMESSLTLTFSMEFCKKDFWRVGLLIRQILIR